MEKLKKGFFFHIMGVETKALYMLGKWSTTVKQFFIIMMYVWVHDTYIYGCVCLHMSVEIRGQLCEDSSLYFPPLQGF